MIFVFTMLFTLFMIIRMKIIGHYSLLVTHYSLLGMQTPDRENLIEKGLHGSV